MLCGLGEEGRTRFRKKIQQEKKKGKKGKIREKKEKKPHCGHKWVGWDKRVS